MPRRDHVLIVDDDRYQEAEPLDAGSDLHDLPVGVGARVTRIGLEGSDCHRTAARVIDLFQFHWLAFS